MTARAEFKSKHQRIVEYLSARELDAVLLTRRANFSWLTGGRLNYVNTATEQGVATLCVFRDRTVCICNSIEQPRMVEEEVGELGISVISYRWFEGEQRSQIFREFVGGRDVAYDIALPGIRGQQLDRTFDQLRWPLTEQEVQRYRQLGRLTAGVIEGVARGFDAGETEQKVAGVLAGRLMEAGARPWVVLVAGDERIEKFRHPIPTGKTIRNRAMLVVCAEMGGLIVSTTRLVAFGGIDDELRSKQQAVVNVDGAFILSSRVGATLGEVFAAGMRAYSEQGHADQWHLHHQGGPTGYVTREFPVTPGDTTPIVANQALAWNPSITGTKSEDTTIVTESGPEIISGPQDWPMIEARFGEQRLARPDILIR